MGNLVAYHLAKNLFEQYYPGLVEFAIRLIGCDETARDLVQDVFVKIIENEQMVPENPKSAKSYLYSMVKNSAFNYLRHNKVIDHYQQKMADDIDYGKTALEAFIYSEAINQLHKTIQTLPHACQVVCRLSYLEEKSVQQTADISNTSVNTVKTHKKRAIDMLRKQLVPALRTAKAILF